MRASILTLNGRKRRKDFHMKREFLKGLGLDDDVIEKIITENGKDVQAEIAKTNALQKDLDDEKEAREKLENEIGELKKADPKKLQETINDLQEQINNRNEADEQEKQNKALADRFSAVAGEKKFINDFTKNGVLAEFKDALSKDENKGKGDKEIFEALIKDREGIFSNSNPPADVPGAEPINEDTKTDLLRAAMGLPPEK